MIEKVTQIKKSRILPYGFKVYFNDYKKVNDNVANVLSWINLNLSGYDPAIYQIRLYSNSISVYFSNPDHAMRFKLVWMT
jgi:hypothetical protein